MTSSSRSKKSAAASTAKKAATKATSKTTKATAKKAATTKGAASSTAKKAAPRAATARSATARAATARSAAAATPRRAASSARARTSSSSTRRARTARSARTTEKAESTQNTGAQNTGAQNTGAQNTGTQNAIERAFVAADVNAPTWFGRDRRNAANSGEGDLLRLKVAELQKALTVREQDLRERTNERDELAEELQAARHHLQLNEELIQELRGNDLPTIGLRLGRKFDTFLSEHPEVHEAGSSVFRRVRATRSR